MSSLLKLPTELLNHVFAYLDSAPPSESHFDDLPRFQRSSLTAQPLKNISLVAHGLRTVVLDRLFAHLRVNTGTVRRLLQFAAQASLSSKVESIVIEVRRGSNVSDQPLWWVQLLDQIPATRIIIQCEPEAYKILLNLDVNLDDAWAFKVPCQYVELGQPPADSRLSSASKVPNGLLTAKPWELLKINEGSSLAAYTSYEYFLKKHPSLIASLERQLKATPQDLQQLAECDHTLAGSSYTLETANEMLGNLRTFSYTSVFPFYNHVDEILQCVRRMKKLKNLFVKLCPEPGSTVLEDGVQAAKGHIDLNDPWSEVNIAYNLITHTLIQMSSAGPLELFVSGDVGVTGIRDTIVNDISTKLIENWAFDGYNTWKRQPTDDRVELVQGTT